MATVSSKLLGHLPRSLRCSLHRSSHSLLLYSCPLSSSTPHFDFRSSLPLLQYNRCFSSASDDDRFQFEGISDSTVLLDHSSSSGLDKLASTSIDDPSFLPVDFIVSLLNQYHDYTGLPWWLVIASSTLAMRLSLFPVLVVQLRKLKRIAELLSKLPPPLPPPFSGRSYFNQFSLFWKERQASGCPSFLWFLASFSVQVPCFLLWMTTIRRMSLDHHPGFECGGILWFQNLTEASTGAAGPVLPLLIAFLHYTNVQIAFSRMALRKDADLFGLLAKFYKYYLDVMTFPLIFIGFVLPQGSLVYWVTNSSLSCVQQLALKHPVVRMKLGLPQDTVPNVPEILPKPDKTVTSESDVADSNSQREPRQISAQDLSPRELLALSVQVISKGDPDQGISLLQLALDKDPGFIRAMIVLGQTFLQTEEPEEAVEYLERAISKLFFTADMAEEEYVDLLIVASQWAGIAYIKQYNYEKGIQHLERVAHLEEPQDPKSKAHYYDGLLLLASGLSNVGRKAEAAKYLAAAYDESYSEMLEQFEKDDEGLVGDLMNSRRADY